MSVEFNTNIDVCRRFMGNLGGLPLDRINPAVNDLVQVYHDNEFTLLMLVIGRRWVMTNGTNPRLICDLSCPHGWSIDGFTQMLREHGFK